MSGQIKNVLVVEDEEKIASVVISFLETKGFHTVWAKDGRQAIELFDNENITMILLDLMLPLISGEEVCKIIRKKSRVPIIKDLISSNNPSILEVSCAGSVFAAFADAATSFSSSL